MELKRKIIYPKENDWLKRAPQRIPLKLILKSLNFINSDLKLTVLYGFAKSCGESIHTQNEHFTKQYINAVIDDFMEYNNSHKGCRKKSVNHLIFSQVKIYP